MKKEKREKLKIWQKTYLLTLALFLFCICAVVFSLAGYSNRKNIYSELDSSSAEEYYIASSYIRDTENAQSNEYRDNLVRAYVKHYRGEGILLCFFEKNSDGQVVRSTAAASSFPADTVFPDESPVLAKIDGKKHIIITDEREDFRLVYARDVSFLDDELRSLIVTFAIVALAVSLILAFALYFILRKLSLPLEQLRSTAERISSGERGLRADEEKGGAEVVSLGVSFNRMLDTVDSQIDELEANAAEKQRLVDNMAHELRTPLTVIHGYAEYMTMSDQSEEERLDMLGAIVSESERLKNLSEVLLDGAWLRRSSPSCERVALDDVISECCRRYENKAKEKGVALICAMCSLSVRADALLLSVLLSNLIDNAVKATPSGGRVSVAAGKEEDGCVCLGVSDTGRGIGKEELLHITEPFFRVDKARSRAEGGTGLGLSLCRDICASFGADMRFSSVLGEGTQVKIIFLGEKL